MEFNVNNNKIGKALKSIIASFMFGGVAMGMIGAPFLIFPKIIPANLLDALLIPGAVAFWFACGVGIIYFTGDDSPRSQWPTREELRGH
jgi:uncharacterized membrane protein